MRYFFAGSIIVSIFVSSNIKILTMVRFRYEGRSMSKFDMAYVMDNSRYRSLPWLAMFDVFSYAEMVYFFKSFLLTQKKNA